MKILFLGIVVPLFSCYAVQETKTIERYLELSQQYPQAFGPKGDWTRGEMEIVDDLPTMLQIQSQFMHPVGIVAEDRFWIWIRDAIILPSGTYNTYNRFIPKKGLDGPAGVVILAVTPQQGIAVNLIFRHATRSWEIELPRGGREKGETPEEAARREVEEETGYTLSTLFPLGSIATDSGIFTNTLRVFFAHIDQLKIAEREEEEAIAAVMTLSKNQVMEAFSNGSMECVVNGEIVTAYCRDSFFAYALLLAGKKGFL